MLQLPTERVVPTETPDPRIVIPGNSTPSVTDVTTSDVPAIEACRPAAGKVAAAPSPAGQKQPLGHGFAVPVAWPAPHQ